MRLAWASSKLQEEKRGEEGVYHPGKNQKNFKRTTEKMWQQVGDAWSSGQVKYLGSCGTDPRTTGPCTTSAYIYHQGKNGKFKEILLTAKGRHRYHSLDV